MNPYKASQLFSAQCSRSRERMIGDGNEISPAYQAWLWKATRNSPMTPGSDTVCEGGRREGSDCSSWGRKSRVLSGSKRHHHKGPADVHVSGGQAQVLRGQEVPEERSVPGENREWGRRVAKRGPGECLCCLKGFKTFFLPHSRYSFPTLLLPGWVKQKQSSG